MLRKRLLLTLTFLLLSAALTVATWAYAANALAFQEATPTPTITPRPTLTPAPLATLPPTWTPVPDDVQLTPTAPPALPVGGGFEIAYLSNLTESDSIELFLINADGTNPRQLTDDGPDTQKSFPQWSFDGQEIAYSMSSPGGLEGGGGTHIYAYNMETGQARQLTASPVRHERPSWSPDGTRLAILTRPDAFTDIYELWVINASDGGNPVQLATGVSPFTWRIAWSPDGTRIAYVKNSTDPNAPPPEDSNLPENNYDVYVINADGTGETRLTTDPYADFNPVWSPDGTRLAYVSSVAFTPIDVFFDINIIEDLNAPAPTNMMNTPGEEEFMPAWSPNGEVLAFIKRAERGNNDDRDIFLLSGGQRQLTDDFFEDQYPSWSPDGQLIAFMSMRDFLHWDMMVIPADGSMAEPLMITRVARDGNGEFQDFYLHAPLWRPQP